MDSHLNTATHFIQKKKLRYTTAFIIVFYGNYASSCFSAEVDITGISVIESDRNIDEPVFRATLNHTAEQSISVNYTLSDGSAIANQDYSATHGTFIFLPGETSQTITVTIIGDRKVEPDETFRITLTHIFGDATIETDFATATIIDDDIPETLEELQDNNTAIVKKHDIPTFLDGINLATAEKNDLFSTAPVYFSEVIPTKPEKSLQPPEKGFFASLFSNIFRSQTKERVERWHTFIETHKNQKRDKKEQIERTNLFFNQLRFRSDNKHWNAEDYWATPIEMLTTNGGDCEDFAIAKFFTLKEIGVDENKMRIVYVESTLTELPHMVLAYYPTQSSDPLILDNLMDDIKPLSERDDLFPIYSFNNHGIWIEKSKQLSIKISETNYIGHWKTLKEKMKNETSNKQ